ncbi:MAG: hypothetical protein SGPRY_014930 [Prymnesium sp.]
MAETPVASMCLPETPTRAEAEAALASVPFVDADAKKGRKLGEAIKYYAIIEICMWLPTTWLVCFRFQPAIRFYSTDTGRKVVHHGANFLERWIPSAHASLMKLAGRIYGSPSGRTTAEWLLINKVILVDGEVVASQL